MTVSTAVSYVMPGLVDLHAHGFKGIGFGGIDYDQMCLGRGTTTAVDAGSSGCATFDGFRDYIIKPAKTRVLALLNVSMVGVAANIEINMSLAPSDDGHFGDAEARASVAGGSDGGSPVGAPLLGAGGMCEC